MEEKPNNNEFIYYFTPYNDDHFNDCNFGKKLHNKTHIVTICSDNNKIRHLKRSAIYTNNDINYIIINWNGFIDKIIYMIDFIKTIPDNDIICFIDAYDVLVLDNVDKIYNKFINARCNILFSSELVCFPKMNSKKYEEVYKYIQVETNFKYLNSGGYIGFKKNIYNMLTSKSIPEIKKICEIGGDQNFFTQYFLENLDNINIKLDMNQYIFQSMCCVDFADFEFQNGVLYNKILNTYPSFIHFNGFGDDEIKTAIDNETNESVDIIAEFVKKKELSMNGNVIKLQYKQFDNLYIKQK
jgi:hypothetical protein